MSDRISRRALIGFAAALALTPAVVAVSQAQDAPEEAPVATIRPTNRPRGDLPVRPTNTPVIRPTKAPETETPVDPDATVRPTPRPRTTPTSEPSDG